MRDDDLPVCLFFIFIIQFRYGNLENVSFWNKFRISIILEQIVNISNIKKKS